MNVDKLFPSKWLKAADLEGRRVTVTIAEVRLETMQGQEGPHKEIVLHFRGSKSGKGLVLNATNRLAIRALYGPETDDWVGKSIELYATQVKAFGKMQDVIRVTGKDLPVVATKTETPGDDDPGLWEPNA